jgi:quinol monooxygenase YgiN
MLIFGKDKDKATYDAHFQTEYFTTLGGIIQKEGLLSAPLDIKTIKPIGGFASR